MVKGFEHDGTCNCPNQTPSVDRIGHCSYCGGEIKDSAQKVTASKEEKPKRGRKKKTEN